MTPLERTEALYEELLRWYGDGADKEMRAASKLLMVALDRLRTYGGDDWRTLVYSYIDTLEKTSTNFSITPSNGNVGETEEKEGDDTQADLTTLLRSAIDKFFDYVDKTNFATLGTFGMVGIFLSVILVLGQIEKSLNVIWKVKDGRSILRKVADYIALMILFPISINIALASGTLEKISRMKLKAPV